MTRTIGSPLLVIFGITGDLSSRKLIPAIYNMYHDGLISSDTKIIGTSRKDLNKDEFNLSFKRAVEQKGQVCDDSTLDLIFTNLETLKLDPSSESDFIKLKHLIEKHGATNPIRLFYFSVPTAAYSMYAENISKLGLSNDSSRILLEKPFGYDSKSAKNLIDIIDANFSEKQVYRIDHYLARDTAQNLMTFRQHNPIFTPLWNCQHIDKVWVRATETIGIEGRSNFYEQTGALRDFTQSHLMQLMAIAMMDIPKEYTSEAIHKAKLEFLKTLLPCDPAQAKRGQYIGYKNEVNNPNSYVETYALVKIKSSSAKWENTEIILETGKAMDKKSTVVIIEFKSAHERRRNRLTFEIQPDEGISLDLSVKSPGINTEMQHTSMKFKYRSEFEGKVVDAYEKVLLDAYNGDQTLFASSQEVMETWRILDPVIEAWSAGSAGLIEYKIGASEL